MKKLNLLFIALVVLLACLFVCGCHDQTDDPTAPIYTSDDSNGYIDSPADTSDEVSSSAPSATTPSVVNKTPLNAKITYAGEFQDGYAVVSFTQNQSDYGAIIDTAGVVQYRAKIETVSASYNVAEHWLYMGDHVYAISYLKGAHSEYAIIDASGNILASSENGDFDLIVTVGDGLAIVYKKVLSGIEYTHYYAAFDKSGKIVGTWAEGYEFVNTISFWHDEPCALSADGYLDEGIYQIQGADSRVQLFNVNTSQIILYGESLAFSSFENGVADAYQKQNSAWARYYNGKIKDFAGEFTFFEDSFYQVDTNGVMSPSRSPEELISERYANQNAEVSYIGRVEGGYHLVSLQKGDRVSYALLEQNSYEEVYSSSASLNILLGDESYLVVQITNGNNVFITILNQKHQEMCSPAPFAGIWVGDEIYATENRLVYASEMRDMDDGTYPVYHVLDLSTGKEISVIDNVCRLAGSFSDGLAPGYIRRAAFDYPYFYINEQGEIVLDTLYE